MASCETCSTFDRQDSDESVKVPLTKISDAGKRGCQRCSMFSAGIQTCLPKLEPSWTCRGVIVPFSSCILYLSPPQAEDLKEEVEFFVSEDETNPYSLPLRDPAQYDTSSRASLDIAKKWFQHCSDVHISCPANSSQPLPTRILEIVPQGKRNYVRLCETKSEIGRYIAVSHCWGGRASIELNKRNLGDYKKEIEWSILPQLFQDIVSFAISLSVQYIWIDSLCIMQDDRDDWHRESVKMLSVYQNSWLTIAATKSPNDRDSLFSKRSIQKLTVPHGKDSAEILVSRRIFHHHDGLPSTHESSAPNRFPLLSRAWVFQERLLSPRILHFNHDEISWDCNEIASCVCDGCVNMGLKQKHSRRMALDVENSTLSQTWRELVTQYSGLEITVQSDRLPAIAGLARQMEPVRMGRYLAGLWSDSFFRDLLWCPDTEDMLKPRPERSHAPSWSWMSIDDKVRFEDCDCIQTTNKIYKTYCRMMRIKCPSLSFENLTDLQGSYITLSGLGMSGGTYCKSGETELDPGLHQFLIKMPCIGYQTWLPDYNISSSGPGRVEDKEPLISFAIHAKCKAPSPFYDYWLQDYFLILRPLKVINCYERIGIFRLSRHPWDRLPGWLKSASEMTVTIY